MTAIDNDAIEDAADAKARQRAEWARQIEVVQANVAEAQAEVDRLLNDRGDLFLSIQDDDPSVTYTHLAGWADVTLPTISTAVKRARARRIAAGAGS